MAGFGNSPQPPPRQPFTIPGPYSSSGMFSPGVANILEANRLQRLRQEQEEAERNFQQTAPQAQSNRQSSMQDAPQHPVRSTRSQDHTAPKQRNVVIRFVFGLLKLAVIAIVLIVLLVFVLALFA